MSHKWRNGISSIKSYFYLAFRKLSGCRIKHKSFPLISSKSILRTYDSGDISVGSYCAISPNSELTARDGHIVIGDHVFINRNCMIAAHEKIQIGNGTTIGPNVCIYDHDHNGKGGYNTSPIIINNNVWIGAGSIILKGVTIGENATVAAGTLVTKDIPANTVVYQKRETVFKEKE